MNVFHAYKVVGLPPSLRTPIYPLFMYHFNYFTFPGYEKSRMFGNAPEDIISILSTQNVTFNAHRKGVTTTVSTFLIFRLSKPFDNIQKPSCVLLYNLQPALRMLS